MAERSAPDRRTVADDREVRHRDLRDIFVAATGVEGFTETQEQQTTSRTISEEESVAEAVTAIAKADGLGDTYTDLVYKGDSE
jgi:hypothetical protein